MVAAGDVDGVSVANRPGNDGVGDAVLRIRHATQMIGDGPHQPTPGARPMRRYVTELIGTFFLVLTIGLVVPPGTDLAPLAICSALMIMLYTGAHISGAHYNPAVSLAVLLRGQLSLSDFLAYVVSQLIGATLAALLAASITRTAFSLAPGAAATAVDAFALELLFTFALALVVLNVATARA